jgi:hypothetical protein
MVMLGLNAAATAAAITHAASLQKPVGPLCIREAISCVSSDACRGLPALIIPIGEIAIAVEELCMFPQPAYAGTDKPSENL